VNAVAGIPHVERASAGSGKDGDGREKNRDDRLPAGNGGGIKSTESLAETEQSMRPELGRFFFGSNDLFGSVGEVEFFAWFEADSFAGGDGHFGAGPRIAADARFSRTHIEDAEATQFDAVASGKCLLETFKDGVDRSLGLVARQTSSFDHIVDNVLLDQRGLLGKSAGLSLAIFCTCHIRHVWRSLTHLRNPYELCSEDIWPSL